MDNTTFSLLDPIDSVPLHFSKPEPHPPAAVGGVSQKYENGRKFHHCRAATSKSTMICSNFL